MKNLFILFAVLSISISSFANNGGIDDNVMKSFNTTFPSAEKVNWYEMPKAWVVNFVTNGVRSRIMYLKSGEATEFTRYYTEANLPFLIRSKVKAAYPEQTIFGVTEVTVITENGASKLEYFVKLEDAKTWLTVKSDNEGNLNVEEKYKKAK